MRLLFFLALLVPLAALGADPGSAEELMSEGRSAIIREDYAAAVRAFLQLLALPENELSRDAREFLALSYERSGDHDRARQEYEKYLQRYPEGEDAVRVRQRLAALQAAPPPEALRAPAKPADAPRAMAFGSFSQFYYQGNSTIDTLPLTANPLGRSTFSLKDESALITAIDLNARFSDPVHENRIVFRDTNLQNFLEDGDDRNRLSAAYYDYTYKPRGLSARIGRQPADGGGVPGRFDGLTLGYRPAPSLRLNALGGELVNDAPLDIDSKQLVYGVSADLGSFQNNWNANVYLLQQTVDGIADRQATGIELRYFAPGATLVSQLEHDILFGETTVAMVQGSWEAPWKTLFSVAFDQRKTPTLQTTNAVIGERTSSVDALLDTYTEEELRERAAAVTATLTMAGAGFLHPVSRRWQIGLDYRVMRISETLGTDVMPAVPDSGDVGTLTARVIGTGIFSAGSVGLFTASQVSADTFEGLALGATLRVPAGARWALGGSLLHYDQSNADGGDLTRLLASLRAEYRVKNHVSLEAEIGIEDLTTRGRFFEEQTERNFFSLGYRVDF